MMGYAVGAFALVCLLSALNGFEKVIFSVYDTYYPDLKVLPVSGKVFEADSQVIQKLHATGYFSAASLVLEENAVIQNGENQVVGLVKGVDDNYVKVVKSDSLIVAGNKEFVDAAGPKGWMAEGLFYKLNLGSDSRVVGLLAPSRENAGVSQIDMMEEQLRIGAIIRPGDENDQKLVITQLKVAQELFERENKASSIELKVKPGKNLVEAQDEANKLLGNAFLVRNRKQQNQAIYKMFNSEKWVAFALMTFVLLIISFNLIGALSMLVLDKKEDITLLKSVGMTSDNIRKLFFTEGVFISLLGTVIGVISGVVLVYLQGKFGFVQTNSTFVSAYPVQLRGFDILLILAMGITLGLTGALLPARKSANNK